jgi:hypothetical protein
MVSLQQQTCQYHEKTTIRNGKCIIACSAFKEDAVMALLLLLKGDQKERGKKKGECARRTRWYGSTWGE